VPLVWAAAATRAPESKLPVLPTSCAVIPARGVGSGAARPTAEGEPGAAPHAKTKDQLSHPAVAARLGAGNVLLLRVLIGPLSGVCARNLAWHGYACADDVRGAEWACLLLALLAHGLPPAPASSAPAAPAPAPAPAAPVPAPAWPSDDELRDAAALGFVPPPHATLQFDHEPQSSTTSSTAQF